MKNYQDFHLKCKDEYNILLSEFNLFFYGYGCKQKMLILLFPNALLINCNFQTLNDLMQELQLQGETTCKNILEFDEELYKNNKTRIIICINFNFSWVELKNLKAIRIVGTLENIDFSFTQTDIENFNFIFRELTTYENYTDETLGIDLYANKVSSVLQILNVVPKKSQLVFCILLKKGDCFLNTLYEKIKKKLMLTKKQIILDLLHEFVDHGIVKVTNNSLFEIKLNQSEKKKLLSSDEVINILK